MIAEFRNLFNTAHEVEANCRKLISSSENDHSPIAVGYHLAGEMIVTKYVLNPFKKMSDFNTAKNEFEELISENFGMVELHFIRYTIQKNIPKFVGYNRNVDSDRKLIIDFLQKGNDKELKKHMMVYFTNIPDLTDDELKFSTT